LFTGEAHFTCDGAKNTRNPHLWDHDIPNKFRRRILGKTRRDKWINNRIRETLDQEPILNYIEKRSIQWYGHVVRMQDYRKPKQAVEAKMGKRRGRGRPRKTWKDCVIDVARIKGKTFVELKRLARDRIAFRK
jgi:hypothetical protein